MSQEVGKWLGSMGYNLLINGVYWGYNPFTNHLLTSRDIQVAYKGDSNIVLYVKAFLVNKSASQPKGWLFMLFAVFFGAVSC